MTKKNKLDMLIKEICLKGNIITPIGHFRHILDFELDINCNMSESYDGLLEVSFCLN